MGMSINAKLIVGLEYDDLVDGLDEDQIERIDEMLYLGELDSASPWYDAERQHWVVGIEVDAYNAFVDDMQRELNNARNDFQALGFIEKHPMVYCVPDVT